MGISSDDAATQAAFADEHDLDFTLLSDPDQKVARQFGAKRVATRLDKRLTFVIDTNRTLLARITSEKDMKRHADEALEVLRSRSAD